MNKVIKYFKENNKKIILSIIIMYIIFTIIFPSASIIFSQNIVVQIIVIFICLYMIINNKKFDLNKKNVKKIAEDYKEMMNKYILIKAVTILLIIKILNNIFNLIISKI